MNALLEEIRGDIDLGASVITTITKTVISESLKVFESTRYGLGLILVLDVEPQHHIEETSDGTGFLLKLHEPGEGSHPLFGELVKS